jgi:RES domain
VRCWGNDEQESFVPQDSDKIKDGRANPARIKYLYIAEEENTALAEIRPLLKSHVSIAKIKVLNELRIADLTHNILMNVSDNDQTLIYLIIEEFSKPNNNEPLDYLPTQYISEYIKSIGFDGIKYNSSLYSGGKNYVIFNYKKCKAISSKLYELTDICYEAKCLGPIGQLLGQKDLYHRKLGPYRIQSDQANKAKLLTDVLTYHQVDKDNKSNS